MAVPPPNMRQKLGAAAEPKNSCGYGNHFDADPKT